MFLYLNMISYPIPLLYLSGIVLSYRSGTRFNPEEESLENVQNETLELKPL